MMAPEFKGRIDRRDELVLTIVALLIPLATLPAMLGF